MNRILIRAPNWIGDQVLAFPFFKLLRQRYPEAWIAVICTDWVKDIQFRGLVDEVIVYSRNKNDSLFKSALRIFQFSKNLKMKGPWDLAITLPNSFSSALMLYWAGATVRRGYPTDARSFLLTEKLHWNPSSTVHRAQAYLDLLPAGVGGNINPRIDARNFWKTGDQQFDPITFWPDAIPVLPSSNHYCVIAPGATADSRRWSTSQFAELIELIHQKWQLRVVIVGGRAEKEIAKKFFESRLPVEDFTERGKVTELWEIFRGAKFTVSNESGLAHVAALCGSRVHIICGAADPKRTEPIGPGKTQVSINPIECWPCEQNQCRFTGNQRNACLNGISPRQVVEEIELGFSE